MTRDSRKFLQPEAISRIARLEVRARQIVEGFLSGMHRSPYFGQSVEFVQHREYVPGDEARNIDWKAWSKTDKYYVKLFEEDTNLRTSLVVDVSESMQFGSGPLNKLDYACSIAAALSLLLIKQQDAVGLTTFDDGVRTRIPQRSQQNHLHAILQGLAVDEPTQKTDMGAILRQVAEEQSRKGMVILISDMFAERESLKKGLGMLRARGHDVLVFQILDDQEIDFDYSGTTKFEGLEESGELICDPKSLRDGYIEAMERFLEELRRFCASNMIDFHTIRTSEHLDAALLHYMNRRVGMRQPVRG
ncbi:DUF58 domain-containing protein [Calycomorphotria hydatis]|uniref:DUF58 domain-containing protein n=1 Tax=Calycomorphotria hydatis TaxID=2528027 RepID=UPI0018D25FF2|nr:DUF58 domain-containing protein [Calycomorphotria hydatis]